MRKKECPSCGKTVLEVSKNCKYCGHSFEQPQTFEQPPTYEQPQTYDRYAPVNALRPSAQNDNFPEVMEEIRQGRKLTATKMLKDATGWDLITCKEWVDNHDNNNAALPRRESPAHIDSAALPSSGGKRHSAEYAASAGTGYTSPTTGTSGYVSPTGTKSHVTPTGTYIRAAIWILFILGGGTFAYFQWFVPWYVPYKADKDAPRYYNMVNLVLRTEMIKEPFTQITIIPYGSEMIVYEFINNEWADVKWNNTKGFVSSPYLTGKDDFILLSGIFGNEESRDCVDMYRYRLALLNYYKERRLYGKDFSHVPEKFATHEKNWQVFTNEKSAKTNSVFFPKLYDRNSKYTDFAVIISHTDSNKRRLLLFTFDSETEAPTLIYEENAPTTGYIQNITLSGTTYKVTYTN